MRISHLETGLVTKLAIPIVRKALRKEPVQNSLFRHNIQSVQSEFESFNEFFWMKLKLFKSIKLGQDIREKEREEERIKCTKKVHSKPQLASFDDL